MTSPSHTSALIYLGLLLPFAQVFGQDSSRSISCIYLSDISIKNCTNKEKQKYLSVSECKSLVPGSPYLEDMSTYEYEHDNSIPFQYWNTDNEVTVSAIFKFRDKAGVIKSNTEFCLGVGYLNSLYVYGYADSSTRDRYDTVYSSQSGLTFYLDSVSSRHSDVSLATKFFTISSAILFRTKSKSLWTVYTGIGFTWGMSIQSTTRLKYQESKGSEIYVAEGAPPAYGYYAVSRLESLVIQKNRPGFTSSIYIPIGVNCSMGKEKIWKRLNLFYEGKIGFRSFGIPEVKQFKNPFFGHALGFRFAFLS
jgi:hypothetical protein